MSDELAALQQENRALRSQLWFSWLAYGQLDYKHRDLLRRLYGPKSEKLKTVCKGLTAGSEEEEQALRARLERAKRPRKPGGGGRGPPPENLPVVRQIIDLPEEQKKGLKFIRYERTRQTEYRPSQFYQLETLRPVYASPSRACPPKVAPLPPQVIPQAGVAVGFIVHVILSKYADHIPYHRQESIDARGGVFIARQARYRYAKAAANLLMTIRDGLKDWMLREKNIYLQIDETFAALIDPDRDGKTRTAYLWGYRAPKLKACVMEFSISRSGKFLEEFFDSPAWSGEMDLQSDGARMYTRFVKKHPGVRHFECMQHLRKYLIAALKANELEALPLLEEIGKLYAIEDEAELRGYTDVQRGTFRESEAQPILQRLHERFIELKAEPTLFGNLRKAVVYATNRHRWSRLTRYAEKGNGHILIDNNGIERIFRPTKIGLRNYLFIGHPAAGWISAVLYSIIATCKLLKINPHEYLVWVLPKLAAARTSTDTPTAEGLLPHDFLRLQEEQRVAQSQPRPENIARCVARKRTAPCLARDLWPALKAAA